VRCGGILMQIVSFEKPLVHLDATVKISNSDALKHLVDLPEELRNQDVELIILPIGEPSPFKQAIPPFAYR